MTCSKASGGLRQNWLCGPPAHPVTSLNTHNVFVCFSERSGSSGLSQNWHWWPPQSFQRGESSWGVSMWTRWHVDHKTRGCYSRKADIVVDYNMRYWHGSSTISGQFVYIVYPVVTPLVIGILYRFCISAVRIFKTYMSHLILFFLQTLYKIQTLNLREMLNCKDEDRVWTTL